MINIKSYFEKFIQLSQQKEETKNTIQKILKDATGKDVLLSNINYNKGVVYIKEGSSYKNTIYIKKPQILDLLNKEGLKTIDIR